MTLRIGELARRTGVSPDLLRAWESRYGLMTPSRSPGGFRLYSASDERRVKTMTHLIASGLSASEAAAEVAQQSDDGRGDSSVVADLAARLRDALERFDADDAHALLDALFGALTIEAAMAQVLIPYLEDLGDRWERGEASIAQEHFATNLLRGRLLAIARDRSLDQGPVFVLACLPGEEHDLGLIMFWIALSRRGARAVFLGANTPIETIVDVVRATAPTATILSAMRPELVASVGAAIATLASMGPVWVGGAGATQAGATAIGARLLDGDPVVAATSLM